MGFDLSKLGVVKNVPKVNFTEYSGVLSAPPKWGKTTMASMYPNAIMLAFEKGYKAQSINVRDINEWQDFVDFVDLLEENRKEIGDSIQTIIIDTVNEAYPMAEPYMCRVEGRKDQKKYNDKRDVPFGQGWALHDQYFRDQINRIYALGFEITYITHSQVKTIRPKNAEEYDVYKTSMPDRLEAIIFPECDYILYGERVQVDDGNGNKVLKRRLTTKGTDELEAGNRVYLEDDIIFDTEEEAMEKFQQQFRESIEKNLRKSGNTVDIDVLAEQQKQERIEKVDSYVEKKQTNNVDKNNELIEHIKANVSNLDVTKMQIIMKEYGFKDFTEPSTIQTEALIKIKELIK